MRRYNVKKIFALLLALVFILSLLVSCKNNVTNTGTFGTESEIVEVDLSEYTIVYSETDLSNDKKHAETLQSSISENLSVALTIENDKNSDPSSKEILVGVTEREQSVNVYREIDGKGYAVAKDGDKIVIIAYNDDLLASAVEYFVDTYIETATGAIVILPKNFCHISELENTNDIVKNGTAIYSIVRGEDSNDNIASYARDIYNAIFDATGIALEIKTDYLKRGEVADSTSYEILIGDTNRPESKEVKDSLNANEYAVKTVGNKIVIMGWYDATTVKAKDAFIIDIAGSLGRKIGDKRDLLITKDNGKKGIGNSSWIVDVPKYMGGSLANIADVDSNIYELFYTDTSAEEFEMYCSSLGTSGYTLYDRNEKNGNIYCSYFKSNSQLVYGYYTAHEQSVRIIVSPFNDGLLPLTFNSTEKVTEFSVTQLELDYSAQNGGGMSYIITLEDGSFIVIDGGTSTGTNIDHLHQKLQELNKRSGTPVIAAWYLTHVHQDHCNAFTAFAAKYGNQYKLEYAIHNIPSKTVADLSPDGPMSSYYETGKYTKAVKTFIGEVKVVRVHTGMKFNIHGAEFEVLYTWDDCFPNVLTTINDYSTVIRMTLAGQTFLWTGDIQKQASSIIVSTWGDYVKSDYLQLAHHGWYNGGSWELYRLISPSVIFWTISSEAYQKNYNSPTNPAGQLNLAGGIKENIVAGDGDRTIVLPYTAT